jgi:hypothetical protein
VRTHRKGVERHFQRYRKPASRQAFASHLRPAAYQTDAAWQFSDLTGPAGDVSLLRVKRTDQLRARTSEFDPFRTEGIARHRRTLVLCKHSISPSPGGAS